MITLITGIPGAGKTINTLQLVEEECEGREIYYSGIAELTLPWTEIDYEELNNWSKYKDGSVFVIDEVQRVWPNVAHSKPSPKAVEDLDTHRHRGFDFYLITQQPTRLDFRARHMVGRHIHCERARGIGVTRILEWSKAISNPDDFHSRRDADSKTKRLNKKYFDVYKSASEHNMKFRMPTKGYIAIAFLVFAVFMGFMLINRITDRGDEPELAQVDQPAAGNIENMIFEEQPNWGGAKTEALSPQEYIEIRKPRIPDVPWSAPIYDHLTVVQTYPRPQCMLNLKTDRCKCYTQQATPLTVSDEQCRHIIENGWFNPFVDENKRGGERRGSKPLGTSRRSPEIAIPSDFDYPIHTDGNVFTGETTEGHKIIAIPASSQL